MYIMAREPIPDMSPTEVRTYFSDKHSEKDLADAYAITQNKFWWIEDKEYDYEDGTPEYKAACAISDEWCELMKEYESKIFEILRSEGITIPEIGSIAVLAPFMERHGYFDGNGWWIKK